MRLASIAEKMGGLDLPLPLPPSEYVRRVFFQWREPSRKPVTPNLKFLLNFDKKNGPSLRAIRTFRECIRESCEKLGVAGIDASTQDFRWTSTQLRRLTKYLRTGRPLSRRSSTTPRCLRYRISSDALVTAFRFPPEKHIVSAISAVLFQILRDLGIQATAAFKKMHSASCSVSRQRQERRPSTKSVTPCQRI